MSRTTQEKKYVCSQYTSRILLPLKKSSEGVGLCTAQQFRPLCTFILHRRISSSSSTYARD